MTNSTKGIQTKLESCFKTVSQHSVRVQFITLGFNLVKNKSLIGKFVNAIFVSMIICTLVTTSSSTVALFGHSLLLSALLIKFKWSFNKI